MPSHICPEQPPILQPLSEAQLPVDPPQNPLRFVFLPVLSLGGCTHADIIANGISIRIAVSDFIILTNPLHPFISLVRIKCMLSDVIKKISVSAGIDEDEVQRMIEEKRLELSGLVSQEGAAYIVAKELGITLLRKPERLKLKSVVPGMQNVDVVAKVQRVFPAREFSTPNAKGKVMNVILADETSTARLSLWNEEIDRYGIAAGDVLHITGYVKEDNLGGPEIRIGRYGNLQKSDERIDMPSAQRTERSTLEELREGQYMQIRAMVVNVFESDFFFSVCPVCNASLKGVECNDHGIVEPRQRLVVSGIIDDGTENMRFVAFGEVGEKIVGEKSGHLLRMSKEDIMEKIELGKEFVLEGRVRRNAMFNRLEFTVNNVEEVDVRQEIGRMLES